jgi:acetylglutamate kinase
MMTSEQEQRLRGVRGPASELTEALPYLQRYNKKTIVVKYGGHAIGQRDEALAFARDIVFLKQCGLNPIVVHGGGPQIAHMLERLSLPSRFVRGMRVTDAAAMQVVEMVLSGSINKELVSLIQNAGGLAIGLSGRDAGLLQVVPMVLETGEDLGFVGQPHHVNPLVLHKLIDTDIIPVIAPVGVDAQGQAYNVNADTAAGAIAAAVQAERLLFLTDIMGVCDAQKRLLPHLNAAHIHQLIAEGTISGGMIPKVETALQAVQNGVNGAVILDGRVTHAVLLELFTQSGIGTLISNQTPTREYD